MKKLLIVNLILCFGWSNAQEVDFFETHYGIFLEKIDSSLLNKIRIIKFSNSEGVIFPAEYADNLIGRGKNAFDPDSLSIVLAEKELVKQYCFARNKFDDNRLKEFSEYNEPKEYRRHKKYYRKQKKLTKKYCSKWQNDALVSDKQIIGYTNEEGEKILWIKILDFREDPYNLKNVFYTSWIDGWHGWFETNVRYMNFHIKNNEITVH